VRLRRDGRGRAFRPKNRRHVFTHTGSTALSLLPPLEGA
jgi:hypothetical protein